ncbi:LysR family transcriptional regulator [Aminipila butyrica]|uniref:LysR family transcriptional regulator n=1 Tax=Aminipila butyrica TaxID=433296 RepID=A0A858BXP3_9FIRM|nr:LysR family transcriptional regulator [Aminipila butyrica]QIB69949.1 LysR family transcriptional regulator [Aminipila butyrica]
MTLRHFKIFVSVCDHMSMTAAAEELFISQSAISQAVAELERYYDVRLFERLSRKLYLTEAGERLLGYGRHMIRMNGDIEKDMRALHEHGAIRLGVSVTIGANVLPELVSLYKKSNPKTTIEVFESNTQQIEKRILQDQTDIALVEGDTSSPDLISFPFMDDELVLICGMKHRFASLSAIAAVELEKEEFIIREKGSGTRKTFEEGLAAHNISWKASWVCNNADTIKMAVAEGLGISIISKRAVEKEAQAGSLCVKGIEGIRFERKFKIIYHKNKYLTDQMKDFISLCLNS